MKIARVYLLAAGRGRRAGGPKAWMPYNGKPLLEAHLGFFRDLVGGARISIAIQEEWRSRCQALSPESIWVAADPDAHPIDSLQKLIIASPAARAYVLHVDMPVFDKSVYEALWKTSADVVTPTFGGRPGHPVLLSPQALAEISSLDSAKARLDVWIHGHADKATAPVSTDAIFLNMNEKGE